MDDFVFVRGVAKLIAGVKNAGSEEGIEHDLRKGYSKAFEQGEEYGRKMVLDKIRGSLGSLMRWRAGTEPIDDVLQVIEKEMSRNRLLEWVALAAITTSYEAIRDAVLGLPTNGSASS